MPMGERYLRQADAAKLERAVRSGGPVRLGRARRGDGLLGMFGTKPGVRDGWCSAPGCRQPAAWADLDHVVPYPHGPTSEANLQALCRRHHRMKHTGRWQVRRNTDGTTTWVTPAGRRFTDRPEGAAAMARELAQVRPLAVRSA